MVGTDLVLILVVVLIVVLMWRGPKMLPRIGEALGKTVKSAREEIPGALRGDAESTSDTTDPGDKPGSSS